MVRQQNTPTQRATAIRAERRTASARTMYRPSSRNKIGSLRRLAARFRYNVRPAGRPTSPAPWRSERSRMSDNHSNMSESFLRRGSSRIDIDNTAPSTNRKRYRAPRNRRPIPRSGRKVALVTIPKPHAAPAARAVPAPAGTSFLSRARTTGARGIASRNAAMGRKGSADPLDPAGSTASASPRRAAATTTNAGARFASPSAIDISAGF
jgi:hypothetical protein